LSDTISFDDAPEFVNIELMNFLCNHRNEELKENEKIRREG
jgi:hypothetical protein